MELSRKELSQFVHLLEKVSVYYPHMLNESTDFSRLALHVIVLPCEEQSGNLFVSCFPHDDSVLQLSY